MAKILVTGGAGFIGSHTCVVLLEAGHDVIVLDDFRNSSSLALSAVKSIVDGNLTTIPGDVRDPLCLSHAFRGHVDAVIHFAGLKAVGKSVQEPLKYWDVNVGGTLALLRAMDESACRNIVFSSSATLYGDPDSVPIFETANIRPVSPYGQTKRAVEMMLGDLPKSWNIKCLRYFNPIGSHPSGLIGEDPTGLPNNLFPYITQVAAGKRDKLSVFGNDYPTKDGSGIRDYIHVMDLAEAHVAALSASSTTLNVGTGVGHSVLEVVRCFEETTGISIPYEVKSRREGDVTELVASTDLATKTLQWKAKRVLADMCRDGWAWQKTNPNGYV